MGARNYWDRMLVYFGIADDEGGWDESTGGGRSTAVRDRESGRSSTSTASSRSARRSAPARSSAAAPRRVSGTAGVGVVPPRNFNDAQVIADHFKDGMPVIVNLQETSSDLAKRLIDFASGLTYGLDGHMAQIADRVFLLTPPGVDVSAEERAAMAESGFFNQS